MKPLAHAAVAILAVSAGIFSGRLIPQPQSDSRHSSIPIRPSRATLSENVVPALPDESVGRNLDQVRDLLRRQETDPLDIAGQMQRLGPGALKELASAMAEASLVGESDPAVSAILKAALRQLYRLEGITAIEWVSGWSEPSRLTGMEEILAIAVRDNVTAAKPWIERHEITYGRSETSDLYSQAMKGGKERTAEDLIKVYETFPPGSRRSIRDLLGNFADDFDFAKAFSALRGKKDVQDLLHYWAIRDKQAAWAALKSDLQERGKPASYGFDRFVTGVITKEGEEQGLKTVLTLVAELPDDQKELCLRNLNGGMLTTGGIQSIIPSLSSQERRTLADEMVASYNGGESALLLLDSLPREEMIAALESSFSKNRGMFTPPSDELTASGIGRVSKEVEHRYSLTAEEMERIRAARGF